MNCGAIPLGLKIVGQKYMVTVPPINRFLASSLENVEMMTLLGPAQQKNCIKCEVVEGSQT